MGPVPLVAAYDAALCCMKEQPLSSRLFPAIDVPSLIGELSFVWLVAEGVRADAWEQRRAEVA